ELLRDFEHIAMGGDRRDFQDAGHGESASDVLDVFVENFLENLAGFWLEIVPEIHAALAQAVGPLAPGAQRGTISDVAQEVEGVSVRLARIVSDLFECDAAVAECLEDGGTFI